MFATAKQTAGRLLALALALAICLTAGAGLWAGTAEAATDYSIMRVKLSNANDGSINLRFTGDYTVEQNGATVTGDVLLTLGGSGLVVANKATGSQIYTGKSVRFNRTASSGTFRMYTTANGNNQYLGDLLVSAEGGGFTAVNYIPMDHYLYGVVAHEMNNSWPLEALKAQSVAARGYAADVVGRYKTYDLVDTPQDQVYKGYKSEYKTVKEAVDATTGQVLTKNGKIIRAYYGASNGGQTELTENVWTNKTSYCVMKDDPYDLRNPTSPRQTIFFPKTASSDTPMDGKLTAFLKSQVAPKLKSMGYSTYSDQIEIVGIDSLAGSQRKYAAPSRNFTHVKATVRVRAMQGGGDGLVVTNPGGSRPVKPEFTIVGDSTSGPIYSDAKGDLYDASSVQWMLDQYEAELEEWTEGQASLESSGQGFTGSGSTVKVDVEFRIYDLKDKSMATKLFTNHSLIMYYVEETSGGWNIVNARYGHGVGMSQRGAQQMATEGKSYQDILFFYYDGVTLTNLGYAGGGSVPDLTTDPGSTGGSTGADTSSLTPATGEELEELGDNVSDPESLVPDSGSGASGMSGRTVKNTTLYKKADGKSKLVTVKKDATLNVLVQSGDMLLVQTKAGTTGFASHDNVAITSGSALLTEDAALFDASSSPVSSLSKGDRVTILGSREGMYQVRDGVGQEGYVPLEQLQLVIDKPQVILPEGKRYGQTTGKINLYKDKKGKTVLTTIPAKSLVEVVNKTSNGYYNVIVDGKKGAVKQKYIKLIKKGGKHPNPTAFIESYIGKNSASVTTVSSSANAARSASASTAFPGVAAGAPSWTFGYNLITDPAINDPESTGTIKGQTVNMRKEASTGATIVKQLPGGERVTIIGSVGDFYQVRDSGGATGYVVKDWVEVAGGSAGSSTGTGGSSGSKPTSRVGIVRTDGVNVRSSANTTAAIVGTLKNGEKVDVIGSSGAFYKVRSASGIEGYISDQYLSVQEVETDMLEDVDDDEDGFEEVDNGGSAPSTTMPTTVVARGTITGATVRLRANPSSTAEVVTTIPAGEEVGIMATNSGYYKVFYNGHTGYVLSTYIPSNTLRQASKGGTSSGGSSGTASGTTGTVSVSSTLRMRDEGGNVIASLANGTKVTILDTLSDRYKVSANGQTGYVSKQYIKLGSSASQGSGGGTISTGSGSSSGATGTVTANSLRLRTLEGTVLGTLTKGAKVTIQQTLSDRYKVTSDGRIGYVSKQYIKLDGGGSSGGSGGSSSSGTTSASGKGQANAGVNVRASASTSAKRMGVIYKNEVVQITGQDGEWYRIEAKGMTGYVQKKYIDKV